MLKKFIILHILLPVSCFAQLTISGRVLNQTDTKPVSNASVFLNNATIGDKTNKDGVFTLRNITPGKYDLVISIVGFESYNQTITVGTANIILPDIILFPKSIALKEVKVSYHADPDREKYYGWFKDEFLGVSQRAQDCKIINPEILDFDYNQTSNTLTVSSGDFLKIRNEDLGYQVNYLLTNFSLVEVSQDEKKVYYKGSVLFEELKGSPSEEQRWKKNREEMYENSPMHFLRAALNNRIEEEGFRVQRFATCANSERPSDNVINAKIAFYKNLKSKGAGNPDSLSFWIKKAKLPKTFQKLIPFPLKKNDIVTATDKPGQYALNCSNDALYVAYSKNHHFHIDDQIQYLYNKNNTENTLINFNEPEALFNINGIILNPYSVIYYGVWGRNRVAEQLPTDYVPERDVKKESGETADNNIAAKIDTFNARHVHEKAYLQFDKPYYAAGDTIYFKAYVTEGLTHKLSNLSGVLHVDLINASNKIDQSIKLHLDSGLTWGDFTLPDSLPEGNYTVRAYTRWMFNNDDDNVFTKIMSVGSLKKSKIPESVTGTGKALKPDVQFFPEGGSLVNGIRSKVAFKVVGSNGLGINVKGSVIDNDRKEIVSFVSSHLGMGSFYLDPAEGKIYNARLTYPDGSEDVIELPKANTNGVTLSVNNDNSANIFIKISATETFYKDNINKDFTLVISSGATSSAFSCSLDKSTRILSIPKHIFHSGAATVTLFSPANEPLNERLFFIQNHDHLNLDLNTSKKTYITREKVSIKVQANTSGHIPASGNFSVSVLNENVIPVSENDETTIFTNLLLRSALKGYIEQPNYYFTDRNADAANNLDLLMLTQGYRYFDWQRILSQDKSPVRYTAEKSFEINGLITNLSGKPLSKGTITLIPVAGGPVLSSTSDEKGFFHFGDIVFTDTTHFILSAVKENGNNLTKIIWLHDEPPVPRITDHTPKSIADTITSAYLLNARNYHENLSGYRKGIMLKEVKIKERKFDNPYETQSIAGAGNADQVMHAEELERISGPLIPALNGRLRGVLFVRDTAYLTISQYSIIGTMPHPMLVIIDGVEGGEIKGLQTSDIETVEVLKNASASAYGMQGGAGVLIITTKKIRKTDPRSIASVGVLPISPVGFYKAREFYSPKYDIARSSTKQRDLRSTIYWQPELTTDKDGNASFEFYNADTPGTYKVVVEGIDENGNLGRQVYRYKVQ